MTVADSIPVAHKSKPASTGMLTGLYLNQAAAWAEQSVIVADPDSAQSERRSKRAVCMTIRKIMLAVAARYGVPVADLRRARDSRGGNALPRMLVCWLAHRLTPYSLVRIGRHFGNRDPKTVAHAIRRIDALILTDRVLADVVSQIEGELV